MNNIDICLERLSDIDMQTLYAEGDVLSDHVMWSEKVSMIFECLQASGKDCEEFIQEAKSVGTGISVTKTDSLLKRIWDFIRRLIRSIINKISDVLTKLKIRNYEYIEIPMDKSLVEKDLDTLYSIYTDLAMDVLGTLIDSMSSDNDTKYDTDKMDKLIQRVSSLNILKGIDDGKRHGVKPNEFMALRDKIRYIDKSSKELLKRTETILKNIERKSSEKNPANPKETEFMKKVQKLATDVSNATTKLFASFKFGSINKNRKMDKENEVISTVKNIQNLSQQMLDSFDIDNGSKKKNVSESYYDLDDTDDIEYIDETDKPFNEYLKNHNYDPKTNTLTDASGKRMTLPNLSKKEINRINRFMRENDYDPKDDTIGTNLEDGKRRAPFKLSNYSDNAYATKEHNREDNSIKMGIKSTGAKPVESNKEKYHEEGHLRQFDAEHDSVQDKSKALDEAEEALKRGDIEAFHNIMKNASADSKKKVSTHNEGDLYDDYQKFIDSRGGPGNKHDKPTEAGADRYSMLNNPYAKQTKTPSGRHKKQYTNRMSLENMRSTIKYYEKELNKLEQIDYKEELPNSGVVVRSFMKFLNWLDKKDIKKKIKQCDEDLKKHIENGTYPDYDEEKRYSYIFRQIVDLSKEFIDGYNKEIDNRDAYLKQYEELKGSQARKLEGRQGKHKGKK